MPTSASTESIQILCLFLLVAVAVFARLAHRLGVPYPILLVIAGLGISFVPHVPSVPLKPDLVFTIFLPPLLYAAAWQTNWRDFRQNLFPIAMLAVGLVGFTVACVAIFADRVMTGLDFRSGFLLAAVVAATDAVAATSIASTLRISPRATAIISGESLVNDATALLALEFGLSLLLRDHIPSVAVGLGRLLWLIAGGMGCGLALGRIVVFVERWVDEGPLEMVVSLVVPYVAYLTGEQIKASGVLAVVTCGLFLSRRSTYFLSAPARLEILAAWRALDFILNGVVFLLIGLQLPDILHAIRDKSLGTLIAYALTFAVLLLALRMLWVFPGARLSHWLYQRMGHRDTLPPSRREAFVIGWAGMRGVVALAAAYSLPRTLSNGQPFVQRDLIIFITFAVILVSLVGQGLSLPPLIRALGLGENREAAQEELDARCRMLGAAVRSLEAKQKGVDGQQAHDVEDLLHRYTHRLDALNGRRRHLTSRTPLEENAADLRHAQRGRLARDTVRVEREELLRMRDEERVGDDVLRVLERELDLMESRYDSRDFGRKGRG